jgi:tellurite methyltransferase
MGAEGNYWGPTLSFRGIDNAAYYRLGAGVGRHTVVMGRRVPPGSIIAAVDVLPSALRRLRSNMRPTGVRARTRCVDLVNFSFDGPAYLVVAFSAIEQLPGLSAIADLLGRIARELTPGGIAAVGVLADRSERAPGGERHPAPLESAITCEAARWALGRPPDRRTTRPREAPGHSRDGRAFLPD